MGNAMQLRNMNTDTQAITCARVAGWAARVELDMAASLIGSGWRRPYRTRERLQTRETPR